jgi:hypothetical protein
VTAHHTSHCIYFFPLKKYSKKGFGSCSTSFHPTFIANAAPKGAVVSDAPTAFKRSSISLYLSQTMKQNMASAIQNGKPYISH